MGGVPVRGRYRWTGWPWWVRLLIILVALALGIVYAATHNWFSGCHRAVSPVAQSGDMSTVSVLIDKADVEAYKNAQIIKEDKNGQLSINISKLLSTADYMTACLEQAQAGNNEKLRQAFNYSVWQAIVKDESVQKEISSLAAAVRPVVLETPRSVGSIRTATATKKSTAKKTATVGHTGQKISKPEVVKTEKSKMAVGPARVVSEVQGTPKSKPGEFQIIKQNPSGQVIATYKVILSNSIEVTGTVGPIKTGSITGTITKSSKSNTEKDGDDK